MKKSSFSQLLAGFSLFSFITHAQDFTIGASGGISIPNLTAGGNQTPLNTGYRSGLGPDAAVFAEFKYSTLFSIEPTIEYSSQGGKKDGMQAFTTPDAITVMYPPGQAPKYLYADYKSEAVMNYLMIPILAKFNWNINKSLWRVYVDAGPFAGFLLSAKQITSGESQFYTSLSQLEVIPGGEHSFNNTQDIKDQLYTFNIGVEGNIGVNYRFGHSNIFIEGGGNYGFLNIQKGTQNGKNNIGAATSAIGYSYLFGR